MSNELFNDKKKIIIDNIYYFLSCICQQIIVELLQIYTTVQKFGVGMILFFIFFEGSLVKGCFYLIKNTIKTVKLWNNITILNTCFLLWNI